MKNIFLDMDIINRVLYDGRASNALRKFKHFCERYIIDKRNIVGKFDLECISFLFATMRGKPVLCSISFQSCYNEAIMGE